VKTPSIINELPPDWTDGFVCTFGEKYSIERRWISV